MSEALYRKYRPHNFDEIVGQEQVKQILKSAIANGDIAHAYIFYGPRGTGKTTTARILAKAINCAAENLAERPCGTCDSCKAIDSSSHMDVIEIDAASYRGIDEVRKIRDAASYRPTMGHYKVYIVDEFHMLTREAFNALLKTLEEPPEHILFILATTNLEKVPETVLSRCQIFTFKPFNLAQIIEYLKRILTSEGKEFDEEGLRLIALAANGGMRDAVNLLQRVLVFSGKAIENDVRNVLGILPSDVVEKYISALLSTDFNQLMEISKEMSTLGYGHEALLDQAIEMVKNKVFSNALDVKTAASLVKLLWEISRELRFSDDKRRAFETLNIVKTDEFRILQEKAPKNSVQILYKGRDVDKPKDSMTILQKEQPRAEESEDKLAGFLETLFSKNHILSWTLLKLSRMSLQEFSKGKRLIVSFSHDNSLAEAIMRERFEAISDLVKSELGVDLELATQEIKASKKSSDALAKLPPEQQAYMKRIMSLFDSVEVEVEEEENGQED
ncbi:hypothetical protein AT15_02685 [Kosmotoga arenicorallina S304]|uniref:DNA polymerase III subunit gamma/tau n=1 Tax=Kosmotoga arenicorallina S304 TaxID=1453497 RepID=A0A182C7S4_9BACT|nr:DNA polymerase III subunit gamma/tau [Kosmotoga arenicorallina]OAA31750.1 hypothetical protein AT15_02685 [Kosmotoga arenicorallina S304]